MSQTDPRAMAVMVPITTHGCECRREICATHAAIAQALADAERRGMERAAKVAEMFSINKQQIHPDIIWENMSESARMVCHMTCQNLACLIRAQAQADKEG